MNTDNAPYIEGEKTPFIGFDLYYELKIDKPYSVRWRMFSLDNIRNRIPLCEKDRKGFESVNTPYICVAFLDNALTDKFILEAWYRIAEEDSEMRVEITITPTLGPPAILSAIWQNRKQQDVSCFISGTVCLAIRTVNIPLGQELKVLLYDKKDEKNIVWEKNVSVGENGKSNLEINPDDWKKIREKLKDKKVHIKENHIYANVTYDPAAHTEFSFSDTKEAAKATSVLTVFNSPNKFADELMKEIQRANKSVVVNAPDTGVSEEKIPVDVRIDVYFDGTMGNRWNIDAKRNPDHFLEDGDTARKKLQKNKTEHMLYKKKKQLRSGVYQYSHYV